MSIKTPVIFPLAPSLALSPSVLPLCSLYSNSASWLFSRTLAQVWPHCCFLLKSWLPDIHRAFSLTLPRNKRRPSLTRPIERNICLELPFTISLSWFILHIEFIPIARVLYLFVYCLFLTSTKNISYKKEILSVLFSH